MIAEPPTRRASLLQVVVVGLILGTLLACATEIARMVVFRNQHVVVPGRVYRTAQLTPSQLRTFVERHGIRTVVNLRGRPFASWYPAEGEATQALGISQEDVTTSANHLPSPVEIRRLIEIFDRSEHPLVMHCQQGADRTGLAAAMYQLLYTDADYAVARHQCSPRYGHVPLLTTAAMDQFFDYYEDWLRARGAAHSPAAFRRWATAEYCPGPFRCRFELLGPTGPTEIGRPVVFRVRVYNISREPWHWKAGSRTGVSAFYFVRAPDGGFAYTDGAGFFDRTVPAGGYVDLDLPVPPLRTPGRYTLYVDLVARNVTFNQYGSEALLHDWDARNPAPTRGR